MFNDRLRSLIRRYVQSCQISYTPYLADSIRGEIAIAPGDINTNDGR